MRSTALPFTLATLALLVSFQEQCRIQAQFVEAGPSGSLSSEAAIRQQQEASYLASSRFGSRYAADEELLQQRRREPRSFLKRRQLLDDDSEPAVVVRPVRESASNTVTAAGSGSNDADDGLSRSIRGAIATPSLDRVTRSVPLVTNGPRPGAPTSTSVTIPVTETEVPVRSSARPEANSASESEESSSSSSSSTSSTQSEESTSIRSGSTFSSSSSTHTSHTSSQPPSTVLSTTTLSSSAETASPTDSAAPTTSVWQAYNKNSKFFPVAVVVTVVVGIAILVALVAILQCIARAPRFRKDKSRPLLIPRDSTWSGSDNSSSGSGLSDDISSRKGSISSQAAAGNRSTWENFGSSPPSRVNSASSGSNRGSIVGGERDITANPSAHWAKQDFLPYSGENDASPVNNSFSIVDVYPASLQKFDRGSVTPALASAGYGVHGIGASNLGSPYPPFPSRSAPSSSAATNTTIPHFQQTTLPVIRRMDPATHANYHSNGSSQQPPMTQRVPGSPSILVKSRPGPAEQQSGYGQSINRGGLPSHLVLPPGVAERRRWERCST